MCFLIWNCVLLLSRYIGIYSDDQKKVANFRKWWLDEGVSKLTDKLHLFWNNI